MRPAAFPFLAAAGCLAGAAYAQDSTSAVAQAPTMAQEVAFAEPEGAPLLLRIRPRDEAPEDGSGPDAADAAREAEAARREAARQAAVARAAAAREAFEARITARANRAIASVCTGCLGPVPRSLALALAPPDAVAAALRPVPASVAMTEP